MNQVNSNNDKRSRMDDVLTTLSFTDAELFIINKFKKLNLTRDLVYELIGIGFCQPKFYKPSAWRKSKLFMDNVVCALNLAFKYDYGRGKGKYSSHFDIDEVKARVADLICIN